MPIGNIIGVPLVNGVAYAHADIILNILGTPIVGCTAIAYSQKQEITPNFSTGTLATSVGFGASTATATITLNSKAVEALTAIAPEGRIENIPFFDVGVNYTTVSGDFVRHSLKNCRFKGRDTSSSVGNSQIEEPLELFVADIDYKAY